MAASWVVLAGNILAMIASMVCVIFILLIWQLIRARWAVFMAISFSAFFVIRIAIVGQVPILESYSRAFTALVYVALAAGFIDMWLGMRHYYMIGPLDRKRGLQVEASRMAKLAAEAAIRAADAATNATEAATRAADVAAIAQNMANGSRRASEASAAVAEEMEE